MKYGLFKNLGDYIVLKRIETAETIPIYIELEILGNERKGLEFIKNLIVKDKIDEIRDTERGPNANL